MAIVRYSHVSKVFQPDHTGVFDVNLSIEPGELVVITGPTGSGKTTLMKLLTREYRPTTGELFFFDTPVHTLKGRGIDHHRRRLGIVFQDYRLIPDLTVWENMALPLHIVSKSRAEIERRVTDLLALIKLSVKAEYFPGQLSGGEAQRVGIGRALALGPELIFADEPTGNLDEVTSKSIANLLQKINELGTTVVVSTHDVSVLAIFSNERHVHIEAGTIVSDGGTQRAAQPEGIAKTAEPDLDVAPSKIPDTTDDSGETDNEPSTTPSVEKHTSLTPSSQTNAIETPSPPIESKKKSFFSSMKPSVFRKKQTTGKPSAAPKKTTSNTKSHEEAI